MGVEKPIHSDILREEAECLFHVSVPKGTKDTYINISGTPFDIVKLLHTAMLEQPDLYQALKTAVIAYEVTQDIDVDETPIDQYKDIWKGMSGLD